MSTSLHKFLLFGFIAVASGCNHTPEYGTAQDTFNFFQKEAWDQSLKAKNLPPSPHNRAIFLRDQLAKALLCRNCKIASEDQLPDHEREALVELVRLVSTTIKSDADFSAPLQVELRKGTDGFCVLDLSSDKHIAGMCTKVIWVKKKERA